MKRGAPIVLVLLLVLALGIWVTLRRSPSPGADVSESSPVPEPRVAASTPPPTSPLLGDSILRDYASPNLPPENDLTLMSRLMENSLLLLKAAGNRPLSANEDWADLLRGKNAAQERFLADASSALNPQGQLIDRWQSPLFFHALGGGRYEIRSAGPDQILWTDDDLHRNADGSFRRGTNLNSPSLFESATRGPSPATGP